MITIIIVLVLIAYGLFKMFHLASIDFFEPVSFFNSQERKRLRIYLNNLTQNKPFQSFVVSKQNKDIFPELVRLSPSNDYSNHPELVQKGNHETGHDLSAIITSSSKTLPSKWIKIATFADSIQWYEIPTLVKARHIHGKTMQQPYAILMPFRRKTHFGPIKKAIDLSKTITWDAKQSAVIWRGGPSGTGFHNHYEPHLYKPSRETLVRRWALEKNTESEIDVGLTAKWKYHDFSEFLKPSKTMKEMLHYKYLLSVEGNDVATNLKWALASNSLVIMPVPKVESWFTESLLKPWVHFVPIEDDFSDLLDMKRWCDQHPQQCQDIIQQANAFVQPFLNIEREMFLARYVLEQYIQFVDIQVTE